MQRGPEGEDRPFNPKFLLASSLRLGRPGGVLGNRGGAQFLGAARGGALRVHAAGASQSFILARAIPRRPSTPQRTACGMAPGTENPLCYGKEKTMKTPKKAWWKTTLKAAAFLFAALVTLIALALSWFSLEGRRDLDRIKKELLARGEKLSILELVPPPIPDEQNFFADPMWDELVDLVETDSFPYKSTRLKGSERQLGGFNRSLSDAERQSLESEFPEFAPIDASAKNIQIAREVWRTADKEGEEDRRRAAEFVLAVLSYSEPVISRIEQLAQRPEARFPVNYEDGMFALIEHVIPLLSVGQLLSVRGEAELELGRRDAARRDALAILRLARTLQDEPLQISSLVELSIDLLSVVVIEQGIKGHRWTDADLIDFERVLAQMNVPRRAALVLRGERGIFNLIMERLTYDNFEVLVDAWSNMRGPEAQRGVLRLGEKGILSTVFFRIYRDVFLAGDQAFYNRAMQKQVDALDQAAQRGINVGQFPPAAESEKGPKKYRYILSAHAEPTYGRFIKRVAFAQNQITQARIACALERYRLAQGEYPESLEALVPDYFETLPLDIITLQPMLYRRVQPDEFLLWSVGWNEIDEGGQPGKKRFDGDWVWGERIR